jgi:hypothetical protein
VIKYTPGEVMLGNDILFCRFETQSEIPANYLAWNFSELYTPVLQRETTHDNSTFELSSPSVRLIDCLQWIVFRLICYQIIYDLTAATSVS